MAYEFHIERDGGIPLEKWRLAVAAVPGVRLYDRPMTAKNPASGISISVEASDGDAAVLLDGEWIKVFRYFEGRVQFKAVDLDDEGDPVATAAISLAQILAARIVGDEGERYR